MFYNFWSGAAAFVYCFFVFTFSLEWLEKKAPLGVARAASILCIACAVYVFAIGAYLAIGWSNPFAGQDLAGKVHSVREWIAIAILVVWPFFLMLVGLATAFLGWKTLHRAVAARGRRPAAS